MNLHSFKIKLIPQKMTIYVGYIIMGNVEEMCSMHMCVWGVVLWIITFVVNFFFRNYPTCSCGQHSETPANFIMYCPWYPTQYDELTWGLTQIANLQFNEVWNIKCLLFDIWTHTIDVNKKIFKLINQSIIITKKFTKYGGWCTVPIILTMSSHFIISFLRYSCSHHKWYEYGYFVTVYQLWNKTKT